MQGREADLFFVLFSNLADKRVVIARALITHRIPSSCLRLVYRWIKGGVRASFPGHGLPRLGAPALLRHHLFIRGRRNTEVVFLMVARPREPREA